MKKQNKFRMLAMLLAATVGISSSGLTTFAADESETEKIISSPILITEVVPNTDNDTEGFVLDAYEYFEVTNISDQTVDLKDYNIVYVNGSKQTLWNQDDITEIRTNESILIWIKNDGNIAMNATKSDFCRYHNIEGKEDMVAEIVCGGLSNSGIRTLAIATGTGKLLTTATYVAANSEEGKIGVDEAITFTYEGNTATANYDQEISPFTTNGIDGIYIGAVKYSMTYDADGNLSATVPAADLSGATEFEYTVSIFDGTNTAKTEAQKVRVIANGEDVDTTKAPALVVTEIIPDTSNVGGSDAYEFIEIYNNSDMAINLKDYRLEYTYPETGVVTTWWETSEDKMLQPSETLVFWVINGPNEILTIDDFNAKFSTSLTANELIRIESGGMANGSHRGVQISTNVGDVICNVAYNNGVDDTTADKSITYQNQYINGGFTTIMTANAAEPTPGTITEKEQADFAATTVVPKGEPVVQDQTATEFTNATEELDFTVTASSEEITIKTVKLYLKTNLDENFTCYNLTRTNGDTFTKTLGNVDIINKKSFTYYFEVSDGTFVVATEEKKVTNTDASLTTSLNVTDGQILTENQQLIANGNTLIIDGKDVSADTIASINGYGKIAFEATDTDVFFKNAVAIGEDVIGIFNDGTYSNVKTYVYDIDASYYDAETMEITVAFHTGNKANVLEHNIENNDDFTIRNIRMILPNGKTLTPSSYKANKGLGAVEHDGLKEEDAIPMTVATQQSNISMGDGTSKYEIVYAIFTLTADDYEAIRYIWDTTSVEDGEHTVSNGTDAVTVVVDNTAPVITTNMTEGQVYHAGTIEVSATDAISENITTVILLDGKTIENGHEFRSLEMVAGEHILKVTARDEAGNVAEETIKFVIPKESASIDENVSPENGTTVTKDPTLSVTVTDETNDEMTVTFKAGNRYILADENITQSLGVSDTSGEINDTIYTNFEGNGFPYEKFDIDLGNVAKETVVSIKWSGTSNNQKTFMYAYNVTTGEWDQLSAKQTIDGNNMTLVGEVVVADYLMDGSIKVIVQNGEGYTPTQYSAEGIITTEGSSETVVNENGNEMNVLPSGVETENKDDTDRDSYDFTFVVESDTQYYNEDFAGNSAQANNGIYLHQINMHNWILNNRDRMNIQYLFHNGDIVDDSSVIGEWEQADAAYAMLDKAALPYGVLAGNHDVGHLTGDYINYSTYFGADRYSSNAWYGESYEDNRGHYDLITVGGIDFIMMYVGWGIGDEQVEWMNEILAQYPERYAILNFHEYLLASGGLGEEPQLVYDEVISQNENVIMILSGHYHNSQTVTYSFTNEDGSTRNVYAMLFDYQGFNEGGDGYLRLMHFDLDGEQITIRTYTPSYGGNEYSNYGDYDALTSSSVNEGNDWSDQSASLNYSEHFAISFADLGIEPKVKTLSTTDLEVNVYGTEVIGTISNVQSGDTAFYTWENAKEGANGWYAEVTDENGGLTRTNVYYVNVNPDVTAPELIVEANTTIKVGTEFDIMDGVSAIDDIDGDVTASIIITGKVNTSIVGTYQLVYEVADSAGNKAMLIRTVIVETNTVEDRPGHESGSESADTSEDRDTNENIKAPETGDARYPMMWSLICVLAIAVIVRVAGKKSKFIS